MHPLALALLLAAAGEDAGPSSDLVRARLLSEARAIAPDQRFAVGLHLDVKAGWHVYWENPGDSGLPVTLEWRLPPGFSAGPIEWPAPHLFRVGPLANYGYEGEVLLPVQIAPAAPLPPGGEVLLRARTTWLACEEECIPGEAELELRLPVASAVAFDEAARPLFERARRERPLPAPWPVHLEGGADGLTLRVDAPRLASGRIAGARFFPSRDAVVENAAPQSLAFDERGLALTLRKSALALAPPTEAEGVLVLEEDLGDRRARHAFAVRAAVLTNPEHASPSLSLLEVLLFALLGGVLLNLMPCVFPVLSLKVLGILRHAGEDPARLRLHGVVYALGVVASFALLAGALLLLRAAGEQIGWGFQLQSPVVVALLAYAMLAMGLSLSGVFEIGGSIMGVGSGLTSRPGLSGSFFTGVLATVVATPCTAPFMGAAVGYAVLQPAPIALSVFLALGFGLALPLVVLSFSPRLLRRLPRPGRWMVTLQAALAFPLYGTVAWLLWVLAQQRGPDGLAAALAGLVLVALAAWAFGTSRHASSSARLAGSGAAIAAGVLALGLLRVVAGIPPADGPRSSANGLAAASYSDERLRALLEEGRPVFVNFTAAWCVTCLVNERTSLSSERVRRAFEERGVAYLKGDWTDRDPAITRALARYGRSGVPLYLFCPRGEEDCRVLPQILTESLVLSHLDAHPAERPR